MTLPKRIDAAAIRAAVRTEALGFALEWTANEAAKLSEIARCEEVVGSLPADFRAFLRYSNGATMSVEFEFAPGQRGLFLLNVLSTMGIVNQTSENRQVWDDSVTARSTRFDGPPTWGPLIVFADWQDGNLCVFDPDQRRDEIVPVIEVSPDIHPREWREMRIASSFDEWITRIFDAMENGQHPVYWLPSPLALPASPRPLDQDAP